MTKERLVAFTDAVLAIIMTILVLELEKPSEASLAAFWDLKEAFFAYTLSFFWLGSLWIGLNGIWEHAERVDSRVIWWNMGLLFTASFIPYATGLASVDFTSRTMQGFYGLVVIVMTIVNWFLHKALDRPNADVPDLLDATSNYRKMLVPDILIKCVGLILALTVYPPIMMYSVLLAAVYILSMKAYADRKGKE